MDEDCASMRVIARACMICMRSDHERTYCVIKSRWSGDVVDCRGRNAMESELLRRRGKKRTVDGDTRHKYRKEGRKHRGCRAGGPWQPR